MADRHTAMADMMADMMADTDRQVMHWISPGLGALLVALLLGGCRLPTSRSGPQQPADTPTKPKPSQTLQAFQPITGTPYQVAAIIDGRKSSRKWESSSYEGDGSTRNLVFLDTTSLASHRLFATNQFVILESKPYPEQQSVAKTEAPQVTQWFTYRMLTQDSNDNDVLDPNDRQSFGVSAASGKDYTEVLTGINAWFGITEIEPGRLLVVYEKNGSKIASLVDLKQRVVLKSQPLTELGAEVE